MQPPDDEPIDALDADAYTQPSDSELLALRMRAAAPDVPGVSYRCPPASEEGAFG